MSGRLPTPTMDGIYALNRYKDRQQRSARHHGKVKIHENQNAPSKQTHGKKQEVNKIPPILRMQPVSNVRGP